MIQPIIKKNLDVLFVGINPVIGSVTDDGYDYFSNNSTFYTVLKKVGITDKKISSKELLDYNLGILNFYYDVFGSYKGLYSERYKEECMYLIGKYMPERVAIMSKHVANIMFPWSSEFGNIGDCNGVSYHCVPFPTYPIKMNLKLNYYKELL